jgi:hypothetical protein
MMRHLRIFLGLFLLPCLLLINGCNVMGIAAQALPPDTITAQYHGLAGQSVGVMVWAERGISLDFPSISLDVANSVENKLLAANHLKELKGITFPVRTASIARYQQDHPNLDLSNMAEIAPKLGVSRLIYIEINDFSTRAAASVDLFRGTMTCNMQVIEVTDGVGKVAFKEENIKAVYPEKVAEDGTPNGDDIHFYMGTIDTMSTQIGWRLIPHEEER